MSKKTNFEISKKLLEIGFKAKSNNFVNAKNRQIYVDNPNAPNGMPSYSKVKKGKKSDFLGFLYKSYDLETILEALPRDLNQGNERYNLTMLQNCFISYINKDDNKDDYCCENGEIMACIIKNKETMVDMASRLLIKLHENDLIKFKE